VENWSILVLFKNFILVDFPKHKIVTIAINKTICAIYILNIILLNVKIISIL